MELYDVVMKLVGAVEPIGETREDDRRFENLKALTSLTDELLTAIDTIALNEKDRVEFSRKRAGAHCKKFLDKIGIKE